MLLRRRWVGGWLVRGSESALILMRDGYERKQLFQSGSPVTEIFKNQQQGDSLESKDNNNNRKKEEEEEDEQEKEEEEEEIRLWLFKKIVNSCIIPPSRSAPQPVTQQDMPAGKTWADEGRQMGWMVLLNFSGSLSSSKAMS